MGTSDEFTSSPGKDSTSDESSDADDKQEEEAINAMDDWVICLLDELQEMDANGETGESPGFGEEESNMMIEYVTGDPVKDSILAEALGQINPQERKVIQDALMGNDGQKSVVAWDISDLRPMDVLQEHWFELKDPKVRPIC